MAIFKPSPACIKKVIEGYWPLPRRIVRKRAPIRGDSDLELRVLLIAILLALVTGFFMLVAHLIG